MNNPTSASAILKTCRTPPISISPTATVRAAIRSMVAAGVGAVVAVQDDALVGILTERDVMVKVSDRALDPDRLLVEEIMERNVRTVGPEVSHSRAATLMLTHHCRQLPVVDEAGKVLGTLSVRHLYREQLRRLRGQMDSLESYMLADGPGG
ncbi:MAG: CBS domain-containing protein [Planctomycetota bacterium]|nr:CBS domain-containing protein [Planctomycetota bacterium]